ncbi:ExbD/TolR family protein [Mesobacterium pallidum]|uniref:ExbD/TolR family protein n=1 Tax=Mesobacterium pallidum TaxID=2872037 RepID=UPI001EE205CB|nr:biopolymer transporter ExbD [Mesobacterium pallidum]
MFDFAVPRRTRRLGLTPMIDVVFLLLVFFMLAARFGQDVAMDLALGGGSGADWQGPPRLLTILPDAMTLNGVPVEDAATALAPLMPTPDAPVLLRGGDGTDLQRLLEVMEALRAAGFPTLVLVE